MLPVSEIIYICCDYRKAEIHTKKGTIQVYCTREELDAYLDERFIYCLKSLIINMEKVSYMSECCIALENGDILPLGRNSYIKARQRFAVYIKNRKKTLANNGVL